jgi:signal transduction histidine kinase
MSIRNRLILILVSGLLFTIIPWGWFQLRVLDHLLTRESNKMLEDVADMVNTYYQNFPTKKGLSTLDETLKEHVRNNNQIARIDIFAIQKDENEYVAGAGRISFDWNEEILATLTEKNRPRYVNIRTEDGPARAFLLPIASGKTKNIKSVIAVMAFSKDYEEILSQAATLTTVSSIVLIAAILFIVMIGYNWTIGHPLKVINHAMDQFRRKQKSVVVWKDRTDEWGLLAGHFNSMVAEIDAVLQQNQELNDDLNRRVNEATERVLQLQNQVNDLQKLSTLGYLTANMAHDLGTPLHSIAGMAALILERTDLDAGLKRKLELISKEAERLNTIIRNIRSATRLPELHFEYLSIEDILDETRLLLEPVLRKSGIRLAIQFGERQPPIFADHSRIRTALFNIFQNAIEAIGNEGEITVQSSLDQEKTMLSLSIRDTGCGIPPDLMDRIREPFFSTHVEEGIRGLGLSIVNDILKNHGGSMTIESERDYGTTVTLHFPVLKPPTGDAGREAGG